MTDERRWLVKQVREQEHFLTVVPGRWIVEVEAWADAPPPVGHYLVEASSVTDTRQECPDPRCPPEYRKHDPLSACPWCGFDPLHPDMGERR